MSPLINALARDHYVIDKAVSLINVLNQFCKTYGHEYMDESNQVQTEYAESAGGSDA